MKKLLVLLAGVMMAFGAQAQNREDLKNGTHNVKLLASSAQASGVLGLSYERRAGSFGLGGKVIQSTKNKTANKFESTTFGVEATSHLYDNNDMDVYVAGGIAVTNLKDFVSPLAPANTSDETMVGPSLGIGFMYTLTPNWGVGFEYYTIYNWFSDKALYEYSFSNAALSFSF